MLLRAQRVVEVSHGIHRSFLSPDQFGAHQLEIQAIGNQAIRLFLHAVFDIGDAFAGDRVGAQIAWHVSFQQAGGFLQPVQKFRHGVDIEIRFLQDIQPDAIRFLLVGASEIKLPLHGVCLHAGDCRLRSLRVVACGKYGDGNGGH